MVRAGQTTSSAAATKTFGQLRIDRRVLITPSRTIALANVATVSVGTHVERQPRLLWVVLATISASLAFLAYNVPGIDPLAGKVAAGLAGLFAAGFMFMAFRPDDKTHYLLISSSDGVLSRFAGPDRAILEEVRHLLTDKINREDETATYTINFDVGAIENRGAAHAGSPVHAAHYVNGSGEAFVNGNGAAGSGHHHNGAHGATGLNGANGRGSSSDGGYAHARPAGANGSNGHALNGSSQGLHETHVDFARLIPVVVEMHRFYARQPNAEHLEKRLEELELLMRSGAATPTQKSRVRDLSRELAQILQAYPQVVQVFNDIRGTAGL